MTVIPSAATLQKGGVLLIDKPKGWTSFDAVNQIKVVLRAKIGHCGTLDPLATGLLICCTGEMTKSISEYQKLPKEYTGVITLGATTPTYDLESEPTDHRAYDHLTEQAIREAASKFVGDILQTPPIHSAIKKEGKRAYDLARAGKEVELAARPVTIGAFELVQISLPEVHFRVACSTGTYIRSLANDLGAALGCGGYLSALRRTRIGNFSAEGALSPLEWKERLRLELRELRNDPKNSEKRP